MASALSITILLCLGTLATAGTVPQRFLGGEETSIQQYPGIVQVEFLGTFNQIWTQSCVGNVLTTRWFVSAAHCFAGALYTPQRRRIRAGTTFRNFGGRIHNVLKEHNHPTYGSLQYVGDITVVELETALTFSPVVQPVTIVESGFKFPANLPVVHVGWGNRTNSITYGEVLRDVTIYSIDQELCAEQYLAASPSFTVTDNMICAGIIDGGGNDACNGDVGGPLYYQDVLVGIVSWSLGCADANYPGVSTAISPYTEWIIATAK